MSDSTYNPYAARQEARERADEILQRCDLPPNWQTRMREPLQVLARQRPQLARQLAESVSELLEALNERGRVIKMLAQDDDDTNREEQAGWSVVDEESDDDGRRSERETSGRDDG